METNYIGNSEKQIKMPQTIEKSPEHICILCQSDADLELENGQFICDNCAQIQGELADIN